MTSRGGVYAVNSVLPTLWVILLLVCVRLQVAPVEASAVGGCEGQILPVAAADFSRVKIQVFGSEGVLKDELTCTPPGYFFVPLEKSLANKEFYIKAVAENWTFSPEIQVLSGDCSKDINFVFNGFSLSGRIKAADRSPGPSDIRLHLLKEGSVVAEALSTSDGSFIFTNVFPGQLTVSIADSHFDYEKDSIEVVTTAANYEMNEDFHIKGYSVSGRLSSSHIDKVEEDEEGDSSITTDSAVGNTYVFLATAFSSFSAPSCCSPSHNIHTELLNKELSKGIEDDAKDGNSKDLLSEVRKDGYAVCCATLTYDESFSLHAVLPGSYLLLAWKRGLNFSPRSLPITVKNSHLALDNAFKVSSFEFELKAFARDIDLLKQKKADIYIGNAVNIKEEEVRKQLSSFCSQQAYQGSVKDTARESQPLEFEMVSPSGNPQKLRLTSQTPAGVVAMPSKDGFKGMEKLQVYDMKAVGLDELEFNFDSSIKVFRAPNAWLMCACDSSQGGWRLFAGKLSSEVSLNSSGGWNVLLNEEGMYTVFVLAEDTIFQVLSQAKISFSSGTHTLEVGIKSYKVSGKLSIEGYDTLSDTAWKIKVVDRASSSSGERAPSFDLYSVQKDYSFSFFLPPGVYELSAIKSGGGLPQEDLFIPLTQVVQVTNAPVKGLEFSRKPEYLHISIDCIRFPSSSCPKDKLSVNITKRKRRTNDMKQDTEIAGNTEVHSLKASGSKLLLKQEYFRHYDYTIEVIGDGICWRKKQHEVLGADAKGDVPIEFELAGHVMTMKASHPCQAVFGKPAAHDEEDEDEKAVMLKAGKNLICVRSPTAARNAKAGRCFQFENAAGPNDEETELSMNIKVTHRKAVGTLRADAAIDRATLEGAEVTAYLEDAKGNTLFKQAIVFNCWKSVDYNDLLCEYSLMLPIEVASTLQGGPSLLRLEAEKVGSQSSNEVENRQKVEFLMFFLEDEEEESFSHLRYQETADGCLTLPLMRAEAGKILEGLVVPPVKDVRIEIEIYKENEAEASKAKIFAVYTDEQGRYKSPVIPCTYTGTRVTPSLKGYIFQSKDSSGFLHEAVKTCTVTLEVKDESTSVPLPDILLVFSSAVHSGVRVQAVTDKSGKLEVEGLLPGTFYVQPLDKEYSFQPAVHTFVIEKDVVDRKFVLMAKKFAYSCSGALKVLGRPLRNEDYSKLLVTAFSPQLNEEEAASVHTDGTFIIKGLKPEVNYEVYVTQSGLSDSKDVMKEKWDRVRNLERFSPSKTFVTLKNEDVTGVNFFGFEFAENIYLTAHLKNLQLSSEYKLVVVDAEDPNLSIWIRNLIKNSRNSSLQGKVVKPLPIEDAKAAYKQLSAAKALKTVDVITSFPFFEMKLEQKKEYLAYVVESSKSTSRYSSAALVKVAYLMLLDVSATTSSFVSFDINIKEEMSQFETESDLSLQGNSSSMAGPITLIVCLISILFVTGILDFSFLANMIPKAPKSSGRRGSRRD